MASNGGDASSPPTEAPKEDLTTNKSNTTLVVAPQLEQKTNEVQAPVKQVTEDMSVDNKAKNSETPPSQAIATGPSAEDKPAAVNASEVTSSSTNIDDKTAEKPVSDNATETNSQTVVAKPGNTANGTGSHQPVPSVPLASQTTSNNSLASNPDSKPSSETKTPAPIAAKPSASEDQGKVEKKTEDVVEQKSDKASKSAVTAPLPPSNSSPLPESKQEVQSTESKKPAAVPPIAASKPPSQQAKAVPPVATVAPMPKVAVGSKSSNGGKAPSATKHPSGSRPDGDAPPEKKSKVSAASSKTSAGNSSTTVAPAGGKTPQQILEYMNKTFEQRRRIITKEMPTIPELQQRYPDLFMHKQLLTEFQRITKIDIDQKIQEFCVRFATAVIEMARGKKGAAPVIARWEKAQQENQSLKQYWDMMTALCLLPLHFGENFSDMVQEIGEDEEVVAQGKIVPVLVARGNVYRTDEFFLIAENTIVQEFEEFTIALASLYSSYWVFNMVYPESIENTYNYIQRCIVRQKEPGSIPTVCRNFTKALQKWNREKEGK